MKTKNGDCDNCILLKRNSYKDFIIASDKKNVNKPDIFVVTDTIKYGNEVYGFLKDKYPNLKFDVFNHVICESNKEEAYSCHNHCFSNFIALGNCFSIKSDIILHMHLTK